MGVSISYKSLQGKSSEGGLSAAQCACMPFHRTLTVELAGTLLGWNMHSAILDDHHKQHTVCTGECWKADSELNRLHECYDSSADIILG